MMKKIALICAAAMLPMAAMASGQWTLKGNVFTVDTLFHQEIGPGTTQTSLSLKGPTVQRVFYATVDLTNPNVDIRAVKAGNKYVSCMTPQAQAAQMDRPGARYFAGVNADFFSGSAPIGSTVVDGDVFNTANNTWVNFFMDAAKTPSIQALGYQGRVTFPDGRSHTLNGINGNRGENGLNIYDTHMNGSNSGTNQYGWEVTIEPIEGKLAFSGTMKARVTCEPLSAGKMAIPQGGYVLSGHLDSNAANADSYAGAMIKNLHIGDEITVAMYPSLNGLDIRQMVSGTPIVLKDGVVTESENQDLTTARHPRTLVGYSADRKKVVLMVIDGRSTISQGMTGKEMGDLMLQVGCSDALNLDGGGSSALYTTAFGYRNNPSDGKPRACTNSLWVVYTGPDEDGVARMAFTDPIVRLPKYGRYTPVLYAYNSSGLLLTTNYKDYTLSCPPELGTISDDGHTLFVTGTGTHNLTATSGNATVTVPVVIGTGEPRFRLSQVIVDTYRTYETEVTAKVGELEMPLDNQALIWSTDDASVATVDNHGVVTGIADGTTVIKGAIEDLNGTLTVNVQKPLSRNIAIDATDATVTGTNTKNITFTVGEDKHSIATDFTISTPRAPKLAVNLKKVMYSLPDSVAIDFNPGDLTVASVTFALAAKGQRAVNVTVSGPFTPNALNRAMAPVSDFLDVNDFANYPVTLNSVTFNLTGKAGQVCHIDITDAHGVHTAIDPGQGGVNDITPDPADAADARWYDLQGRPVASPDKAPAGTLLIRRGSKALN